MFPCQDYGGFEKPGSKLTVVSSRFVCVAPALELLDDWCSPQTAVSCIFDVPWYFIGHAMVNDFDHAFQDSVGLKYSYPFFRRTSFVWFHDVVVVSERTGSSISSMPCLAKCATGHAEPDAYAMFVADELFD